MLLLYKGLSVNISLLSNEINKTANSNVRFVKNERCKGGSFQQKFSTVTIKYVCALYADKDPVV